MSSFDESPATGEDVANDVEPATPLQPEVVRWIPLVVPLLAVFLGGVTVLVWTTLQPF